MKLALFFTLVAAALSGCGGGGSSLASADLVLNGTVATGLAIPNAAVIAKCLSGSGSAVTASDGTYKLTVPGGVLPCVLQAVDPASKLALRTLATGNGTSATANITPLTELVTAKIAGTDPASYFVSFSAASAAKVTAGTLQAAMADISSLLGCTVDTSRLGDFISTALKAATAANPSGGDAMDKTLDSLAKVISPAQIQLAVSVITKAGATADLKQLMQSILIALFPGSSLPPIPMVTLPSCK